jgi:hypothetical protein
VRATDSTPMMTAAMYSPVISGISYFPSVY